MSWLDSLIATRAHGGKRLAALLDPDDLPVGREWLKFIERLKQSPITDIFIGGSLLNRRNVKDVIQPLQQNFNGNIVLFPGAPDQVAPGADAVLFLSLISGRNPDFLIGRHVESAMRIRRMGMETIPTGYMLVGDGPLTTAAYMSQTTPIPSRKPEIVAATAVAGEMLGLRALFLDAGSGAGQSVPVSAIAAVREQTDCPLLVGGGIRDAAGVEAAWNAGADLVVIGQAIEERPQDLSWLPRLPKPQKENSSDTNPWRPA